MTYTQIGLVAVLAAVLLDLYVFRTCLVTRKIFWVSYAIIYFLPIHYKWNVHRISDRQI